MTDDDPPDDDPPLVPQPHGGALKPWTTTRGAAANRTSMRAVRKAAREALADLTPQAVNRLGEMLDSPDDRVAVIAAQQVLDRGPVGRPGDHPDEDAGQRVDLTRLSAQERAEVMQALRTLRRLTGRGGDVVDVKPEGEG